jgi:hypothetical protein
MIIIFIILIIYIYIYTGLFFIVLLISSSILYFKEAKPSMFKILISLCTLRGCFVRDFFISLQF